MYTVQTNQRSRFGPSPVANGFNDQVHDSSIRINKNKNFSESELNRNQIKKYKNQWNI